MNIGKNQGHHVLFSDSSDLLRFSVLRLLIDYKGISGEHALVTGYRLCRRHGHIFTVHSRCAPDSLVLINGIGHTGITKRVLRKGNLHMRKHGNILFSLFLRFYYDKLLWAK